MIIAKLTEIEMPCAPAVHTLEEMTITVNRFFMNEKNEQQVISSTIKKPSFALVRYIAKNGKYIHGVNIENFYYLFKIKKY